MSARGTVCLMYHEIDLPGRELCDSDPGYARYTVSLDNFRRQMQFLKDSGTPGVNVSQMLAGPETAVALTFDDGCETDLILAAPILKDLGFQATFYLTVGFLGKRGFVSRPQARELGEAGFEIGCHSITHAYLTDLDDAGLQREIGDAKKELEDIVSAPVLHFSCPGGRWDDRVARVARASGYKSVATSRIGINRAGADPFSLARMPVMREMPLSDFRILCSAKGLWKRQARKRALELTQRVIGNSTYDRVRAILLRSSE
jgi:peptidoglycan/xylan/chitin deacetylase (PgdA/CDA1 family)